MIANPKIIDCAAINAANVIRIMSEADDGPGPESFVGEQQQDTADSSQTDVLIARPILYLLSAALDRLWRFGKL